MPRQELSTAITATCTNSTHSPVPLNSHPLHQQCKNISTNNIISAILQNNKNTTILSAINNDNAPEHDNQLTVCDTGAGTHIVNTTKYMTNLREANLRITSYNGHHSVPKYIGNTNIKTPHGRTLAMHNSVSVPGIPANLFSVGAWLDGVSTSVTFFKDKAYELTGLRIYKDENGQLAAMLQHDNRVHHMADRKGPGHVYTMPTERYTTSTNNSCNITANLLMIKDTPDDPWKHLPSQSRNMLYKALQYPDYVCANTFTVDQLTASQHKYALQLLRLHNSYGHPPKETLRLILQNSHKKSERLLARFIDLQPICNSCNNGKSKEQASSNDPTRVTDKTKTFLYRVAVDNSGMQNVPSAQGFLYFMIIICFATNYTWIKLLHELTESPAVFEKFIRRTAKHTTHKPTLHVVRADNGPSDFGSGDSAFNELLTKYNITREETSGSHTHNSKAERRIGVAQTDMMTHMSWAMAPRRWWPYAARYGVTTRNMLPSKHNPGFMSPYEAATNRKPNMDMLVPFGCVAFVNVARIDRKGKNNHHNATRKCAMLGYDLRPDGHPNGYVLLDLHTNTIIVRPQERVTFNIDMPAMKYITTTITTSPTEQLINQHVLFSTKKPRKYGIITSRSQDKQGKYLYTVTYESGDTSEHTSDTLLKPLLLARKHPPKTEITVPSLPRSTATKLLLDAIAKSTPTKPIISKTQTDNTRQNTSAPLFPHPKLPANNQQTEVLWNGKWYVSNGHTNVPAGTKFYFNDNTQIVVPTAEITTRTRIQHNGITTTIPTTETPSNTKRKRTPRRMTNIRISGDITNNKHNDKASYTHQKTPGKRAALHSTLTIAMAIIDTCSNETVDILQVPINAYGSFVDFPESHLSKIKITPDTKARDIPIPKNYHDAVTGHYREYWREAIRTELNNLLTRETWREEINENNKREIPGKYVLKVKSASDGTIEKFKARWTMLGYMQRPGIDYDKTYAGVSNIVTIRTLLAIACELDWDIISMDVSAAYLCAKVEPHLRIYIKSPTGYKLDKGKSARLQSGLYGSAQGGNLWAKHRSNTLKTLQFKPIPAEPALYMRKKPHSIIYISTIVDDFVITGFPPAEIELTKRQLKAKWQMTGGKELLWIVKLKVARDRDKRKLTISQPQYINDMLFKFGLDKAHTKATPTQSGVTLSKTMCPTTEEEKLTASKIPYQSAVGTLLYCRLTRPDIVQALSKVAKFMNCHGEKHWQAVKRIMKYLAGTPNHGLCYQSSFIRFDDLWNLTLWVDASYADCPDTRRSRGGYLIFLNKNLIAYNSSMQKCMALGTCGAEYMALSHAVKELTWIRMLLECMGIKVKTPALVYEDNQAAKSIAENPESSKRSKHIDVRFHHIREQCEADNIKIIYVSTSDQMADGLTKDLDKIKFIKFRDSVVSNVRHFITK